MRRGKDLCVSRAIMDHVIRLVDPSIRVIDVSNAMGIDFHAAGRLMRNDWVSEEKVDRFLVAFGSEHLWHLPPLDEIYKELLKHD
jgi:hypothetical protein